MGSSLGSDRPKKPRRQRVEAVDPRTFTNMMEQLQEGYIASVAATAGCTVEMIRKDSRGLDTQIIRPPRTTTEEEVAVYAQLKCTTSVIPDPKKDHFSYQFTKREYFDNLAKRRGHLKALLIVMTVPTKQLDWTEVDHAGLLTKRCCYWAYLEGSAAEASIQRPTVHIPTKNILDAYALTNIMDKLDRGKSLHE